MSKPDPSAPIAIVGMACLYPGAENLEAYWANILAKVCAISEPTDTWGTERYLDPASKDPERIYTKAGGFLRDLYRFNPLEFGIMPGSLDGQEPDQFLALKVARDALADAGYFQEGYDHTATGIILGHSTYLHRGQGTLVQHGVVLDQTVELLRQLFPHAPEEAFGETRRLLKAKLPAFNADTVPGAVPNVMTGRIANRLNLQGPNYIIDAACASSLLAVQAAMEELRSGRSDLMLAGGVNAAIPAEAMMVFCQVGGLSRTSGARPFDVDADGTLLGEGLGIVTLKRLADAQRDGDRIYAVLHAVGQASDGRALGLLAPRLEGELLAIQRAYRQSGIDPASISLVEAHGTGIPLGDKTEITALRQVFGERQGDLPAMAIGSVKSMISHTIPAAGAAGLIKTALALYHKVLPPTLCKQVNPALQLETSPFFVNTEVRPWVSPAGVPRRAAVNAFGFGGINTHAILEEAPTAPAARPMAAWPQELVLFSAPDRPALQAALERALAYIDRLGDSPAGLKDLAASLAAATQPGPARAAIVADSLDDLAGKIRKVLATLAKPDSHRLQSRQGAFFCDQPEAGGTVFMFPGEGGQYLGMLADLAVHFPVVRQWFDFWDGVFAGQRPYRASQVVHLAPNSLPESVREHWEKALFSLEIGTESVFIANQALNALLKDLGIEADAMVGHSSGENSALVAAGIMNFADPQVMAGLIRDLNGLYQQLSADTGIVTGALLTVGAVDRQDILKAVADSGGQLYLALDNCHHQSVLFGAVDAIDAAAKAFGGMGGLCAKLPFDRAYHTPLFAPMAEAVSDFFRRVEFAPARCPVYSCASADRLPADEEEIRRLAALQWASTVRFTETVQRLHADGYRNFVEVGPGGNLSAFVGDILQGQPHLAVSVNSRSKPGLGQLLTALARLFVAGKDFRSAGLFEGRACRDLDLDGPPPAKPKPGMLLDNCMPYARLEDADAARLSQLFAPAASPLAAAPAAPATPVPAEPADPAADALMQGYFGLMGQFLATQENVFAPTLAGSVSQGPLAPAASTATSGPAFITRLLDLEADRAVAEFDGDADRQRFLREHVLYAMHVSERDPDLQALPVVPFTASLEMLAEIAAQITRQPHLVAMEKVRAFNWIALDTGFKTVRMEAERLVESAGEDRIKATLYDGDLPLVEGEVVFAAAPLSTEPRLPPLQAPQAPLWQDHELYSTGMFHGPLYHSVRHLRAWDETGIDADLADTPLAGFFQGWEQPCCLTNPVLLDAVGHLTAFWIAQRKGTDFSCFPSAIERIEFMAPYREDTGTAVLKGRLGFVQNEGESSRFLTGNYEVVDGAGQTLFRITGWRDRYFDVPHSFYFARTNPLEGWFGAPLDGASLFPGLAADRLVWQVPAFPAGFLEDAGAVWKRLLAFTLLSREERETWRGLPRNPRRQSDWLMGRIAVKEAVRYWYWQQTGVLLYPADIIVRNEANGRPYLEPGLFDGLGGVPKISLSHAGGQAVALLAPAGCPAGIDLELPGRIKTADLLTGAFSPAEQALLASLPGDPESKVLQAWCAKEAVAKSQGAGLNGRPGAFELVAASPLAGGHNQLQIRHQQQVFMAQTTQYTASIIAIAL